MGWGWWYEIGWVVGSDGTFTRAYSTYIILYIYIYRIQAQWLQPQCLVCGNHWLAAVRVAGQQRASWVLYCIYVHLILMHKPGRYHEPVVCFNSGGMSKSHSYSVMSAPTTTLTLRSGPAPGSHRHARQGSWWFVNVTTNIYIYISTYLYIYTYNNIYVETITL